MSRYRAVKIGTYSSETFYGSWVYDLDNTWKLSMIDSNGLFVVDGKIWVDTMDVKDGGIGRFSFSNKLNPNYFDLDATGAGTIRTKYAHKLIKVNKQNGKDVVTYITYGIESYNPILLKSKGDIEINEIRFKNNAIENKIKLNGSLYDL